jgi:uncharacterized protein YggL (DUF469 family)
MSADAGAGAIPLKRPAEGELQPPTEQKKFAPTTTDMPAVPDATPPPPPLPPPTISTVTVMTKPDGTTVTTTTVTTTVDNSKRGREIRLEQNRKAARESRKRKKVMVDELQRSVVFFSRANNTLKQQNEELTRLLIQAQEQTKNAGATGSVEGKTEVVATVSTDVATCLDSAVSAAERESIKEQQKTATIVATQALLESQGFPAAAARAAAQAMNSTGPPTATMFDHFSAADTANRLSNSNASAMMVASPPPPPPPPMQPGATMQAMANFQQAAAAAMQTALQGMTGVNGLSLLQSVLQPPPGNMTQNFTDTMTAIAMHQAATQHMGQRQQQQQQMLVSTAVTPTMNPATTDPNEPVKKEEDAKANIS